MSSNLLEPWGEWVEGPTLPTVINGGQKGCVEDIGNSTMLIAGTGVSSLLIMFCIVLKTYDIMKVFDLWCTDWIRLLAL